MTTAELVLEGVMLRCDGTGNIVLGGAGVPGLFIADVRMLSRLELTVGESTWSVASEKIEQGRRTVVLVAALGRHQTGDIVITRTQEIDSAGLTESLLVRNVAGHAVTASVVIDLASDFADPFQLRSDRRTFERRSRKLWVRSLSKSAPLALSMGYERELGGRRFAAHIDIAVSGSPHIELDDNAPTSVGATLRWDVSLEARSTERITFRASSGVLREVAALPVTSTVAGSPALAELRTQALADICALRMPCPRDPDADADADDQLSELTIVAAGAPWFLTLFGRDSMITSLLAEPDLPGLARDNLRALIATQATCADASRVAEPGKILHELRRSELAQLGEVPYGNYYGSVDATPLFLSTLRSLGSIELQKSAEHAARAAIAWMRGPGGLTETGFLRYVSDPNGLLTQGWKDSADSVAHADGRIATGAIALCEVQGYAWRALVDTAHVAREVWNDSRWADELETVADDLRSRFRNQFWMGRDDFPAMALDGANKQVAVVGSNAGHLLFSGMLTGVEAGQVAARLLDADMFSGWGIRTLSSHAVRFDPLSYHNGAVWPHDTMIAATGMAFYGMRNESRVLASAMIDAASHFDNRPPELFGGFDRADYDIPVRYADAAVPQAWASAAMLAAVRIMDDLAPPRVENR